MAEKYPQEPIFRPSKFARLDSLLSPEELAPIQAAAAQPELTPEDLEALEYGELYLDAAALFEDDI